MTIQERIAKVKEFIVELNNRTDFGAELELMSLEAHLEELEKIIKLKDQEISDLRELVESLTNELENLAYDIRD